MDIFAFIIAMIAFVIAYTTTPITIFLAKKFGLVTDSASDSHPAHTHQGIIPRAGGVPIYVAILFCSIVFLDINKIIVGILIAAGLLVIIGLLDDKYDLSPYMRFIMNIAIAVLVVLFGLGIPFVSNPFGGVIPLDEWTLSLNIFGIRNILIIADIISIAWLAWMMNMVNWSKGVDGQLPGFVSITAFFLAILATRFTAHDIDATTVMHLSLIVGSAYLGFLPHNFFPQKIMPGYGGGAMAGFLLGILAILSFGKFGTAVLVLAIPTIDAVYTVIRRIHQKKSPFRADWGHFHHRLIDIGWGKRRIAVFYWLVSLMLGIASMILEGIEKLVIFIMVGIALLSFIIITDRAKKLQ
ncbi:MAG: MraY family glycosyltransferase [bacterium]|nr:MraY family glycosyltransferase [bacterium]